MPDKKLNGSDNASRERRERPKARTKPTLTPEQILNPRYAGATPEMVGLALLKHRPKADRAKA